MRWLVITKSIVARSVVAVVSLPATLISNYTLIEEID